MDRKPVKTKFGSLWDSTWERLSFKDQQNGSIGDQGMRQWVWNKEQQQFFYINHVNGSKVWQDDISWDWDEASQKFFYINDGERIYTDCPMPSKTGSSSRWQWDCELRMWFFINDVDGSRLYQQDRSWEWDEALERFFYVDKGKRTYANWKWDWDRHMYDYVEDESRRYEDGSELIRNTNLVDGSDPTIAAPRMIGMQSSIKHEPKQMDTSIKAEEGVMKRTKTETSSSDGVADTLQPLDMNEDDSEAETERLHNTPRKLARTATETSLLSESIYTRTPSKLTHSKTIEHDDSAPPTPTAIADDATMGEAPTTENPGGLPLGADSSNETDLGSHTPSEETHKLPHYMPFETSSSLNWASIRSRLPADWMWDVEYHAAHARSAMQEGCWSCTPLEPDEPKHYPLTIAKAPVVIPVEYQWPLTGGVAPPPDPRATSLIDSRAKIPLEAVRDIFLTFQGSLGFYVLLNGLLQVIVPKDFDTSWASSHLPHKFGGLKVCYIEQSLEPAMLPNKMQSSRTLPTGPSLGSSSASGSSWPARPLAQSLANNQSLKLNDFIEARPLSNHRKERFSGRISLKVAKHGISLIVMSTHVITEAVLAKSHRDTLLGRKHDDRYRRLDDDWNEHVEIWAGSGKVSGVHTPTIVIYNNHDSYTLRLMCFLDWHNLRKLG
jgi:hypothetical protein